MDPASAEKQTGTAEVDMRYYNHLMDQVPCEAHSVPLLLDSLLRQAEATVDQKDPMNEPKPPRKDMLDHSLGDYLDGKLRQLGLKNPEIKVVSLVTLHFTAFCLIYKFWMCSPVA